MYILPGKGKAYWECVAWVEPITTSKLMGLFHSEF